MHKTVMIVTGLVLSVALMLFTALGYGLWHTAKAVSAIRAYDLSQSKSQISQVTPITTFLTTVLPDNQDMLLWHHGLLALEAAVDMATYLESEVDTFLAQQGSISILPFQRHSSILTTELEYIDSHWRDSRIISMYAADHLESTLPILLELAQHVLTLTTELAEPKTYWLFLLQNSDELRATGGFMGSYILVPFENGIMKDFIVEDIYDADGQFTGFIPAPPGVDEYLSSQRGLRLPDANWSPDFASSSETALQFFAFGNKRDVGFVTAVTSNFVADVVAITGPLILPDYDTIITSSNFSQTLRATRDEFFPGSVQKKHILDQLATQLKSTLTQSTPDELHSLGALILSAIPSKDIQFFSLNQNVQDSWRKYAISGDLYPQSFQLLADECNCHPFFFASVESNVGINKINPYIDRDMSFTITDNQPKVSIVFKNTADPLLSQEVTALGLLESDREKKEGLLTRNYVNYHRIYVEPETILIDLTYNGKQIASWDETLIQTSAGKKLKEIGFLLTVLPKTSGILTIHLDTDRSTLPSYMLIPKQASVEPEIFVNFRDKSTQFTLLGDTMFNLLEFNQIQ